MKSEKERTNHTPIIQLIQENGKAKIAFTFSFLQSQSIIMFIKRQMSKLNYIDGDAKQPLKVLFV